MSHVDEGALHAYLDGALDEYPAPEAENIRAHLDACGTCAQRLEEERRVRADAHAMLGLAAPVVDLPSLEELRAYVQRTAQQRRGISRLQRMGWAASVVLALGAGWMLRDSQLQSRAMDIGRELTPRSGATAAAEAPSSAVSGSAGVTPDASAGDAAAFVGADGAGRPSPTAFEEAESSAGVLQARRSDQPLVPTPSAAEATVNSALLAPAVGEASADSDAAKVGDTMADAVIDERAAEPLSESLDRMEQFPGSPVPSADDAVAAPADAVAMAPVAGDSGSSLQDVTGARASGSAVSVENQAVIVAAADSSRPAEEEPRRRQAGESATPPSVVASAARLEPAATRGNAESDAPTGSLIVEVEAGGDEAVAEPLLSVPGHEVLEVANLGEGSTAWGARVRQQMDDGRRFEVFHLEPGIDPSILPPMEGGVGEVSTETPFGWVLVRGAMDDDELRGLLLELFPESP